MLDHSNKPVTIRSRDGEHNNLLSIVNVTIFVISILNSSTVAIVQ